MFATLRKMVKWGSPKHMESNKNQTSLLLAALIGILEDIFFWKKMWLSLSCIFFLNVIFFICIHQQVNFLEFIFGLSATIISLDAFEAWLKYKHRTSCLKRLASHNNTALDSTATEMKTWIRRRWMEFTYLRETNHTKAFLLSNIFFSIVFLIGKYISGHVLIYLVCIFLCTLHKLAPPVLQLVKKIQLNAESDGELEALIPEVSDLNIKLLSIEPEQQVVDDRQSLDYWKPEDLPIEEASDSSDNSSSIITNMSMEKMHTLEKDVDSSDSSEDEYIPIEHQKEQLQSTLEVQPAGTWSNTAYNALYNFTGTVANMVYSTSNDNKRNRVSSVDSSDGFEIIDKNDLN